MPKAPARYLLEHLLDSAIHFEGCSAEFYRDAILRVKRGAARRLLVRLAEEEDYHKAKLEELRAGDVAEVLSLAPEAADLPGANRAGATGEPRIQSGATVEAILAAARSREKAALTFYVELARTAHSPLAQPVFAFLAAEEQKHLDALCALTDGPAQTGTRA